jgi:hypothetical protein
MALMQCTYKKFAQIKKTLMGLLSCRNPKFLKKLNKLILNKLGIKLLKVDLNTYI